MLIDQSINLEAVMPPRDEQDFESRRQQIIDGALHVFASKGFEKATNKDIAEAAGIRSPGLIYHYFKDKGDLFRQVVEQRAPLLQILTHSDTMMNEPPEEVLTQFATAFLQVINNRTTVSIVKLLLGEAIRRPAVAEMLNQVGPRRGFAFLSHYLAHQMELGTLRRMDPGAAARCFVGPLVAFLLTREIFPLPDARDLSAETMINTTVEVFLRGMRVDGTSD